MGANSTARAQAGLAELRAAVATYARGVDAIWGMYPWLDRAPKGRNETGPWWRRHGEYGSRSIG
jgi:predicted dithiol-disulfide oxidoreductase (DUF899 family)